MVDRRQKRREETIAQILEISIELMATEGVAALSLSDVARRLGIQPPSLFKYFPSKLALYDALFAEGARRTLAVFQEAVKEAEPGIPALRAGLAAVARFGLANQPLVQLVFWRPVPGFTPSPEAFQPSLDFVAAVAETLQDAVVRGQVHPDAAGEEGLAVLSVMVAGAMTQQLANEPRATFDTARFVGLLPGLIDMFVNKYPPRKAR